MGKRSRTIGDFFSIVFMKLHYCLSAVMPLSLQDFLGNLSGSLAYFFARQKRQVALASLRQAYPDKTEKWRRRIALESFQMAARESLKVFSFIRHPQWVKKHVRIVGEENMRQALAKGRGVVAVSAHFGNFPLMSLRLAQAGYKVGIMARPMRYKKVGEFVQSLRDRTGIYTIASLPRQQAVYNTLRFLQNNGVVIMQMDQNFGSGGVWVYFFGRLAATPVGPIIFALRSQAPLLPVFITGERSSYTVYVGPEIKLSSAEDKDEMILDTAARITKMIEDWVREYPQYWSWVHRRWKTPPPRQMRKKFKVQKA